MAYAKYASITIDNTKVAGSSDLSNFPILISGTYDGTGGEPDLRITGSGGAIQNEDTTGGNSGALSVPADLAFYNDSSATTQYDHEIEYWDKTTGKFVAWVRIPTLDYDNDTVLYMHYNDSDITTSQENINGVWDANYVAVYHMNNVPTGTVYDSTSSPANLTATNYSGGGAWASGDLIDGKVGKGLMFENSNKQYLATASSVSKLNFTTQSYSLESVINLTSIPTYPVIIMRGDGATYNQYIHLFYYTDNKRRMGSSAGGGVTDTDASSNDVDYYAVAVRDGTTGRLYKDGIAGPTGGGFNNPDSRTEPTFIGFNNWSGGPTFFDGEISEIRVSNIARSADWIATTHETMMNPSTFYAMGSEQPPSAVSHFGMMMGVGN